MTARLLNVRRIERIDREGEAEEVRFDPGVNVLVGSDNSGKTKWLETLDYAFGDDASPEYALGKLAKEYQRIIVELTIDGIPLVLEREWDDPSRVARLLVDDEVVQPRHSSKMLLEKLRIPALHYPKGSPNAEQNWPDLSFRTFLRHIYRNDASWTEFANKQPESERAATMLLFTGVAPAIFSAERGALVERQQERARLEAKKQHFEEMLFAVSRELVTVGEAEAGFTRESLAATEEEIKKAIGEREALRDATLSRVRAAAERTAAEADTTRAAALEQVSDRLNQLRQQRAGIEEDLRRSTMRFRELEAHRRSAALEEAKLTRTEAAAAVLSPLRITHCPSCDQTLPSKASPPGFCNVCHQILPAIADTGEEGRKRLAFEKARAGDQTRELDNMTTITSRETDQARRLLRDIDDEMEPLERQLLPVQRAAAWLLPPELREHDEEVGRLRERLRQLQRIVSSLDVKDQYARDIDNLSKQITVLSITVDLQGAQPSFAHIQDMLSEAMSDYLRRLDKAGRPRWADRQLAIDVDERDVRIFVNGVPWQRALGSTQRAYLFVAYHYALLKLCRTEPFIYPGFVALDFPPDLSAQLGTSGQENYLLAPFVELLARPALKGAQLIAAGRALAGLRGAHPVELHESYL